MATAKEFCEAVEKLQEDMVQAMSRTTLINAICCAFKVFNDSKTFQARYFNDFESPEILDGFSDRNIVKLMSTHDLQYFYRFARKVIYENFNLYGYQCRKYF